MTVHARSVIMTETRGRKKLYTSVDTLSELIEEYFKTDAYMGEGDKRVYAPTMSGLAYHLEMDRKTLLTYSKDELFHPTIKRARDRVGVALEQRLFGNNVTGIIFNLKNNFGWKDVKATEISGADGNPVEIDMNWQIEVIEPGE